jgi:hypothetical protein
VYFIKNRVFFHKRVSFERFCATRFQSEIENSKKTRSRTQIGRTKKRPLQRSRECVGCRHFCRTFTGERKPSRTTIAAPLAEATRGVREDCVRGADAARRVSANGAKTKHPLPFAVVRQAAALINTLEAGRRRRGGMALDGGAGAMVTMISFGIGSIGSETGGKGGKGQQRPHVPLLFGSARE